MELCNLAVGCTANNLLAVEKDVAVLGEGGGSDDVGRDLKNFV